MHVVPLPALADNYIWLLHDGQDAVVVDPGEAAPVEQALIELGLRLRAILLTHHHSDHIGGVPALLARHPVPVYAPHDDRIADATIRVSEGDRITLSRPSLDVAVIDVAGHTRSHIAYVGNGLLLCGDTLFSLGCGRLFEGSAVQMLAAMDKLCALPVDTLVCAAHEYTASNARFALTVEPDNTDLQARVAQIKILREANLPTLPAVLGEELATNPFLRVDAPEVAAWCRRAGAAEDRVARFAALRSAKDGFTG